MPPSKVSALILSLFKTFSCILISFLHLYYHLLELCQYKGLDKQHWIHLNFYLLKCKQQDVSEIWVEYLMLKIHPELHWKSGFCEVMSKEESNFILYLPGTSSLGLYSLPKFPCLSDIFQ